MSSRPSWRSMIGRRGIRANSCAFSITAKSFAGVDRNPPMQSCRPRWRINRQSSYVSPFPHFGSCKIRLQLETISVAGAHARTSVETAKNRVICGYSAGQNLAMPMLCEKSWHQGGQKWGAARAPPKQCADNNNFQNMGDVVPCSFILPS